MNNDKHNIYLYIRVVTKMLYAKYNDYDLLSRSIQQSRHSECKIQYFLSNNILILKILILYTFLRYFYQKYFRFT